MSQNKTPPANKISPAKERAEKETQKSEETVKTNKVRVVHRGISAPQVIFLSLLTYIMLATAVFAFRDQILPFTHKFLGIDEVIENRLDNSLIAGFVPIPVEAAFPSIKEPAALDSAKWEEVERNQTMLVEEIGALRAQMALVSTKTTDDRVVVSPALEERLVETSSALSTALKRINLLEAQLAEIGVTTASLAEQMNQPNPQADMRGLITFQTLQSQALSGQPFQTELQRVIAFLPDSSSVQAELEALERLAPTGRPLLPTLQQDFQAAVSAYMQSHKTEDNSLLGKVQNNLRSFVRVRRTDSDAPANDAIINAAEAALANGNVKGAYVEILKLGKASQAAFAGWMKQARNYHQLPEDLQALQLQLTNAVTETSR